MLLTELLENFDILEHLIKFLFAEDVFRLASVNRRLRLLLGENSQVWKWLNTRDNQEWSEVFGMRDYGDYYNGCLLSPLCRECYLRIYVRHVRACWRSGQQSYIKMRVDEALHKDRIVCFDVCNEFAVVGTLFGTILVWWLDDEDPQKIEASLEQKVDKITIRHQKIIALQDGLVAVYGQGHNKRLFLLLYRKSFEDPDQRLLKSLESSTDTENFSEKDWIPDLLNSDFRRAYRPRSRLKYPENHVTVSTTGEERWARVKIGERHVTFHCLKTGALQRAMPRKHSVEHLAVVHFAQFSNLVYILERQEDGCLDGIFHDMDQCLDVTRINFSQYFDLSRGFYSLFTEWGLLKIGRECDNIDPLSYQFCCFDFETGDLVRRWSCTQSEFGLCLSDCRPEALVTPRSFTLFYVTGNVMAWSERTHRGAAVVCHDWSQWSARGAPCQEPPWWRASSSMSLSSNKTGVLVAGSELGGVVCCLGGGRGGVMVREERTGKVVGELDRCGVAVDNMWVGDTNIVLVPGNFKLDNTLCCVKTRRI